MYVILTTDVLWSALRCVHGCVHKMAKLKPAQLMQQGLHAVNELRSDRLLIADSNRTIHFFLRSIYVRHDVRHFQLLSVKILTVMSVILPRMSVIFLTEVCVIFNVLSVKKVSEGCVKNQAWSSKK